MKAYVSRNGVPAPVSAAFRVDREEYHDMLDQARQDGLCFSAWLRALARARLHRTRVDREFRREREARG